MLLPTAISGALCTAYFPTLGRVHDAPEHATRIAREFTSLLIWMGLPMTALGWAFGGHVVTLLYGAAFHESSIYFEWLCLNVALIYVNVALGTPLTAWGMQKLHLKITATGAAVNIVANLILIPIYGPPAAIATTIGTELIILVIVTIVRRRVGFGWSPTWPMLVAPAACSFAVATAVSVLPPALDRDWAIELALATTALLAAAMVAERRVVAGLIRHLRARAAAAR
jgi:O-antigen/teichoic acid export membrane protein